MARSFDTWLRYQDNSNKPLHGCIQFMVRDGNTSAPIYDQDGTELDNPQITDVYGRTEHQVFINEDVTAYFYKYIGQGTLEQEQELGIDTNDPSKWSLQYTCENQQSYDTHLTANAPTCVPSISALRALEVDSVPLTCDKVEITLLGYNAVGDKEPINYTWASGSTAADNGGSVIKCDDLITGRWIMTQPTEHCDTRHFGAFPQNSYNTPDQSYQIGQCCVYCMLHGLRPFFNGSMDYRWFKYSNMNVVVDAFDVTEDTRFYDAGNNTFQGDWNGNPRFTLGNTNVVGAKNIKTSWNAKSYTGYKNVIIDQQATQKNWQDAHIDVQISPLYGYNFTHCTFEPNGNIGSDNANGINNTFNNCILNEKMFILDGEYVASLVGLCTNCLVDPDDFRNSMWLYREIRCTSDPQPFFDYRDFPNVGKPYVNYTANVITSDTIWVNNLKNANATKVTLAKLDNQTAVILENSTGWYEVPGGITTVILKDSNVKLSLNRGQTVSASNCSIEFADLPSASGMTMTLKDCSVNGVSGTFDILNVRNTALDIQVDATYAYVYDSVLTKPLECGYCDIKGCNIGNTLTLYGIEGDLIDVPMHNDQGEVIASLPTTRYVNGTIKDNYISGQIVLGVFGTSLKHGVNNWLSRGLSITGNTGLSQNPITINRGYSTQYDDYNQYEYKYNTGTMEFKNTGISLTLTSDVEQAGLRKMWEQSGYYVYTPYGQDNSYVFQMNLFTIGTMNTRAVIQILHDSMMANAGAAYGVTVPVPSNKEYDSPAYYGMRKNSGGPWLWNIRNMPIAGGMAAMGYGDSMIFDAVQISN
jgi:hypothetical protein